MDDDHLTIVKPRDRKHDVYAGVLRFVRDAFTEGSAHRSDAAPAAQPLLVPAAQPSTTIPSVGRPRVYLSYTWRTPDFKQRIFELAEKLRENGIDARLDLYFARSLHGFLPPDPLPDRDSWEAWQEDEIRAADCVLVVCSREYSESPENSGAWRDMAFMKKNLELEGAALRKFIPVGFGAYEANSQFIPSFIRGATYYDLNPGTSTGFGFEDLVRRFRTEFAPEGEAVWESLSGVESKASRENVQPNPSFQLMSEKTVFISYSHDSDAHREKVLALSERLREDGIETILDQYVNGSPSGGWPRWMLDQLDAADSVIVVCTETYYRRFRGHEEPGEGKGVDWEGALITQEIYDSRSRTLKFVPVFLGTDNEDWIPEPLRSLNRYALTSESAYQSLYDFLLGQAGVEPRPVGAIKTKPRRKGTLLTFEEPQLTEVANLLISPQEFIDDKVRQAALALNQARTDKTINMRTLVGTLDSLFERDTFRREPSVGLCPTQEWDYRLHSAAQTLRLLEECEPFVEAEARHSLESYRKLTAEVSRYCQRMAAYLFEPVVGLAKLRGFVGTIEFINKVHPQKKWFEGGVDPETCGKIDPHLENAIRQMKEFHDEFCGTAESAGSPRMSLSDSTHPPMSSAVPPSSSALSIWQKKLAFLQAEEAKAADAEQKFSIQQRIEETLTKIRELGG